MVKPQTLAALVLAVAAASIAAGCGGNDQINWHGGAPRDRAWKTYAPMQTAHSLAASVAVGDDVFVISGGSCAGAGGGVEWFSPNNGSGQAISMPPPTGRAAAGAVTAAGKVYFVGGCNANAASGENDAYDFFSNAWAQVTAMTTPRYGFAIGTIDDTIYVAGGGASLTASTDAFESFDPFTNQWTSLPPLPLARQFPGGAVVDGKFYVIGGQDSSGLITFSQVDIFDPATGQWSSGRPMPTGRATGAVALDGQIYVVSGQTAGTTVNTVQVYDPFYDIWFDGPSIPTARIDAQPVAIAPNIFVAGNVDPGESATTAFEALVPTDVGSFGGAGCWQGEGGGTGGSCGCGSGGSCSSSDNNHNNCKCDLEGDVGPVALRGPALLLLAAGALVIKRRRQLGSGL